MPKTLLYLVAIPLMWACGDTARGVKKDANDIADQNGEVTSEAGGALSAGAKTADVKAALLADSLIAGSEINVDSNNDTKTITLTGEVATAAAKARALDIAKRNAPEYAIVNNLTVRR